MINKDFTEHITKLQAEGHKVVLIIGEKQKIQNLVEKLNMKIITPENFNEGE